MSAKLPDDIDCRGKWGHRCDWLYWTLPAIGLSLLEAYREWVIWTQ